MEEYGAISSQAATEWFINIVIGLSCMCLYLLPILISFLRKNRYVWVIIGTSIIGGIICIGLWEDLFGLLLPWFITFAWSVWPRKKE